MSIQMTHRDHEELAGSMLEEVWLVEAHGGEEPCPNCDLAPIGPCSACDGRGWIRLAHPHL